MPKAPNTDGKATIVRQGHTASEFGSDPQDKGTYANDKPRDVKP